MKENMDVFNFFIKYDGGSGRTVRTCTRIGNAKVLITVTFPTIVTFLNDQSCKSFSKDLNLSVKFSSYVFSDQRSYLMPRSLNFPS